MSLLKQNVQLKPYNTFGLDAVARFWLEINSEQAAIEFLTDNIHGAEPLFILGGGSNILLTGDFEGVVLYNRILGREIVGEDEKHVWVKAGAGENWHQFVLFCIENGWGGVENLSLIPGCVGAAPIQNIGAYGAEIKDVLDHLEAIHLATGKIHRFSLAECNMGYRDSIFKQECKGEFLITRVVFRLSKQPQINTTYGAIGEELSRIPGPHGIREVSEAVIRIRQSKLPDPAEIGNAGSFFKNPVVSAEIFARIKSQYPEVPSFAAEDGQIKIPAAWLIQTCGWKGYRENDLGVHKNQALVLVNYGTAKGRDLLALSTRIMDSVSEKFDLRLEREVNVV
ncbi:MAG: UDP-N-acetylmuramate dehydrogenase [Bacteroidia bacterium]|nr:UDP-N-acetylmuramate dehydrogenase [Bacteroidia bacterium]